MLTSEKTWQTAAIDAVDSIYGMTVQNNFDDTATLAKFMRHRLDEALSNIDNATLSSINTDRSLWSFIGRHSLRILFLVGQYPSQESLVETLIRKQKDYGPENIARFGNIGLLIRMHDKIARLENLLKKSNNDFNTAVLINTVSDETIIDTLIDIIGYSAIAIMWATIDEDGNRSFLYKMDD